MLFADTAGELLGAATGYGANFVSCDLGDVPRTLWRVEGDLVAFISVVIPPLDGEPGWAATDWHRLSPAWDLGAIEATPIEKVLGKGS